jgi:hypothetical protein
MIRKSTFTSFTTYHSISAAKIHMPLCSFQEYQLVVILVHMHSDMLNHLLSCEFDNILQHKY